ncbi:MAG: hypothetical protein IJ456_04880 [Bacteroides sp.]|nr:hypothetical protein [Bacteroides sp.]
MDRDRIQTLLDRFFDGTTTREEETLLMQYFTQEENVPGEWEAEQRMFRQLAETRHTLPPVPQGLEERLMTHIDEWAKKESHTPRLQSRKANRWWIIGTAACLLLAGGIGLKMMQQPAEQESLTPEAAYAETERALHMFAHTLNKGVEQMANAQQTTLRMQEKINRTLNQINQ